MLLRHKTMEKNEIQNLVNKYLNNTASPEEREKLMKWYGENTDQEVEWLAEEENEELQLKTEMFAHIQQEIHRGNPEIYNGRQVILNSRRWIRIVAAAAITFMIGVSIYFYSRPVSTQLNKAVYTADVKPGTNKAYLTLANGKRISLTDVGSGEVANEQGISISKTKDGQLVYQITDQQSGAGVPKYNKIETPNGGQYMVVLPDGSKVWLNAASSLRFSATFKAMPVRLVELSGEGYFEVAKSKTQPFIVKTDRQKVEVLGTHFNINSYTTNDEVKTTLLEGSIKVAAETQYGSKSELLRPGQQAVLDANGIKVKEVDVEDAVDWKNGYFQFNNEDLESIMLKLCRWYDMDVRYSDPELKKETFQGSVSRHENVSKVLAMLQRTDVAQFKVEGRTINVSKK